MGVMGSRWTAHDNPNDDIKVNGKTLTEVIVARISCEINKKRRDQR
ncbi:hypothetical protein [uncultured Vagococcus sp.]|nr:hypothetical protein [uncultured Vagococcus sp.]